MKPIIAAVLFTSLFVARAASAADPTAALEIVSLKNGVRVVLAPSPEATTVKYRIRVSAGFFNERRGKEGVAHLLEHYLFTDAKLERDMTYLEVIKEKGGWANATTRADETEYYATIPSKLASWGGELFAHMLLRREFDDATVAHAKGPVYLEIGRPNPFYFLAQTVQDLWPDFAKPPNMWESEFGVKWPNHREFADRFNTDGLTAGDVREFYQTYYNPVNTTVFVAGNFNVAAIRDLLEREMGDWKGSATVGFREPEPHPIRREFYRVEVTSGVPQIQIGTKIAGVSLADEIAGRIYIEDLSLRLMKILRNAKGETYTARPEYDIKRGSGTINVHFEAPPASYRKNLDLVRTMIDEETRQGKLTEPMFLTARDLYLKGIEDNDRDSQKMLDYAVRLDWTERNYPTKPKGITDYQTARDLTYANYTGSLKRLFDPVMKYERLAEPPFFFRFEWLILLVAAFSFWMVCLRRMLARPFQHARIRWVRKIPYPPAYLLQIFAVVAFSLLTTFAVIVLERLWLRISVFEHSILVSDYLHDVVALGIALLVIQGVLAIFARKVMVVEGELWVKSLGYYSRRFPLADILRIELVRAPSLLFSPRLWWTLKNRVWFYDFRFWRRGLLVHLSGGRACFFGAADPERVAEELRELRTTC